MRIAFSIVMFSAMFAFGAAQAAEKPVTADTKEAFESVAASVRKNMQADGRYAYVKPDEHEKVEAGLTEISRLFETNESVDRMDEATKVKLFNTQEVVNSILTLRDRDRLICERGATTGSHMIITTCHTYGELEAARAASHKFLIEKQAVPCMSKACGGG